LLIRALKPATPRHLGASIGICLLIVILAALTVAPAAASPSPLVDQAPQVIGGPVAAFTITAPTQTSSNLSARVFEPVTFDATASQGAGLAYGWTFGDGTPAVSGQKATHLFDLVDDYQVTLAIASASGATVATTQSLRIVPAVPALVSDPPMQQVAIGAVIPVTLYIRAPGPATITASLTGDLITGKPVEFSTGDALAYASLTGQVANESNPTIDQSIIQTPGSVPLKGNVGVQIAYKTSAGASVEMVYQMDLQKNVSPALGVWSITYPNFSLITGKTDPAQPDLDSYYLKGDPGFHHPDDPLVRRYAMIAARAGGALSDDPARVMENVYSYVTDCSAPMTQPRSTRTPWSRKRSAAASWSLGSARRNTSVSGKRISCPRSPVPSVSPAASSQLLWQIRFPRAPREHGLLIMSRRAPRRSGTLVPGTFTTPG